MKEDQDKGRKRLPVESAEELYQNSPCGFVSFLNDGTIFNINRTLLAWLGYEKEEVVSHMRFQQLFKVGGQIYFETHFFPLIKMQGFVNEINFDILRKDRSQFPCLMNVSEVLDEHTGQKFYRASMFDISDRKNYERELIQARKKAEEASRAKAAFLSMISHEIRTPLNAILGIGNLFHKTPLNPQQREYARILLNSSENLLGLVNNLLDMSKIEAHKVKLERRPFSITDLLEILVSIFQVKCQEKNIELQLEVSESLPEHLIGDPYKLNQVLTNLLGNAIKFTDQGFVRLTIEVLEKTDDDVSLRFEVSDTGIGIPPDKLQLVFNEFSQASYDVGLKYGGTGLGLTISQRLLQLHNTAMQVESELGKGSKFFFELKYDRDLKAVKKRKREQKQWDEQQLADASVLIVDDNPMNIFIIKEYLEGWNLNYEAVEDGSFALEAVNRKSFDLILMDLQMPGMNGYETSRAIRDLPLARQPIIIALSASATGDISAKLEQAQIDDYVPKPFSPTQLFDKLSFYLGSGEEDAEEMKEKLKPAGPASIDLSRLLSLGKDNPEVLLKALQISLTSMKGYYREFQDLIPAHQPQPLAALIHKMSMSLHYIQAEGLAEKLKLYQQLLQEQPQDPEKIMRQEQDLLAAFEEVLGELEREIGKL